MRVVEVIVKHSRRLKSGGLSQRPPLAPQNPAAWRRAEVLLGHSHSEDNDCAGGINPKGDKIAGAHRLRSRASSPQEIEKLVEGFPFSSGLRTG